MESEVGIESTETMSVSLKEKFSGVGDCGAEEKRLASRDEVHRAKYG